MARRLFPLPLHVSVCQMQFTRNIFAMYIVLTEREREREHKDQGKKGKEK